MKHLTIADYGTRVGIKGERVVVYDSEGKGIQAPLNRLATITIVKDGVSLSSNLFIQCGMRGIKIFIFDSLGREVVCLSGGQQHAVAKLREHQFSFLKSSDTIHLAKKQVVGKIQAQKAVLKYFLKYYSKKEIVDGETVNTDILSSASENMNQVLVNVKGTQFQYYKKWRSLLMGHEGYASRIYWQALKESYLTPFSFKGRHGRGANDFTNKLLNYGYAVLSTYVWSSLINAGLEVYAGFLHTQRPGKPSLVLDIMEEYRPWVVDRSVLKLRHLYKNREDLPKKVRNQMIQEIHSNFEKRYQYKGKSLKLDTILQRQTYRLAGHFSGNKKYKPMTFKW
jgi:CRISPR-associated protein Cas1